MQKLNNCNILKMRIFFKYYLMKSLFMTVVMSKSLLSLHKLRCAKQYLYKMKANISLEKL